MTSHGFLRIMCGSKIAEDDLAKIAQRISLQPSVIWAHVVDAPDCNIMVEVGHNLEDKKHEKLQSTIKEIVKEQRKGIHAISPCIILFSYQDGNKKDKPDKPGKP